MGFSLMAMLRGLLPPGGSQCLHCRYDQSGLPPGEPCPECGHIEWPPRGFPESLARVGSAVAAIARRMRHEYIGTEHLLLGAIEAGVEPAATALVRLGVTADAALRIVLDLVKRRPGLVSMGPPPVTPRAQAVLGHAVASALAGGRRGPDSGDLLIGIAREKDGVGAGVLRSFGVGIEQASAAVEGVRNG